VEVFSKKPLSGFLSHNSFKNIPQVAKSKFFMVKHDIFSKKLKKNQFWSNLINFFLNFWGVIFGKIRVGGAFTMSF